MSFEPRVTLVAEVPGGLDQFDTLAQPDVALGERVPVCRSLGSFLLFDDEADDECGDQISHVVGLGKRETGCGQAGEPGLFGPHHFRVAGAPAAEESGSLPVAQVLGT